VGPVLGSLLALAVVASGATAAWIYRAELLEMFGLGPQPAAVGPSPRPTPGPTPSPEPDPSPSPPTRGRLVIHGTGDVNLDPSYIPNLRAHGYGYAWSGLRGLFREDDLTVVNLECAASELGAPVPKEFNFRCDPAALPAARRAGVEVANLANNHSGDYGVEALLDSRRRLREAGIAPVGVGRNAAQAARPVIVEAKGWRIAVLGFGGVIPSPTWIAGEGSPGMADGDTIESMTRAVRAAKRRADLVIVTVHWGLELATVPSPDDVERAHAMIEAGADAILGHHAHRLHPLEHYRGKPVAYGLGNFVWPNFSVEGSTTAVARIVVTPDGEVRGRLVPAFIEDAGHPVLVD